VYPSLRKILFAPHKRAGYNKLNIDKAAIKSTIFEHPEFTAYTTKVTEVFENWKKITIPTLKGMQEGIKPKKLISELSEDLLTEFSNLQLIDRYDIYQHLMTYWSETMQDDAYVISDDGWKAGREVYRILKPTKDKTGKTKEKEMEGLDGIESKLIKPGLIIDHYYPTEKKAIEDLESKRDTLLAELTEMEEATGEDGEELMAEAKNDKDKITTISVKDRLKKISPLSLRRGAGGEVDLQECKILEAYLKLSDKIVEQNKKIKTQQKELETKVWNQYPKLTDDEIKTLVVDDKWIRTLETGVQTEMQRISQRLTQRIKDLADRYETPMPALQMKVDELEEKVKEHLSKMGFIWK
jgi:type I restriction enzyme M protein